MKVLVTGSSGHLGGALMQTLLSRPDQYETVVGIDITPNDFTTHVGSISDRSFVAEIMKNEGIEVVLHTATLHKPHVETHTRQDFVNTNIIGTLNLLEEAVVNEVKSFVFTSTTSLFGDAMKPQKEGPAVWITEDVVPKPKNIYGVTKVAAENLCQLMHRLHSLPVIILRTSRFFPEPDDQHALRDKFKDESLKTNEILYRRVDISDIVDAHLLAIDKASEAGFDTLIISATTPFQEGDLQQLYDNGPAVVRRLYPEYPQIYQDLGWTMVESFDRVYSNAKARTKLGWSPRYDFAHHLQCLAKGEDPRSPLARSIRPKGYHPESSFKDHVFPAKQEIEK
jgi:UDP-glucose 4-epimerase